MQQLKNDIDITNCMKSSETPRCGIDGCGRKAKVNILIYFKDRRRKAVVRDLCRRHGCDKEIYKVKGWKAISKAWLSL
jgi:hypothetical protein